MIQRTYAKIWVCIMIMVLALIASAPQIQGAVDLITHEDYTFSVGYPEVNPEIGEGFILSAQVTVTGGIATSPAPSLTISLINGCTVGTAFSGSTTHTRWYATTVTQTAHICSFNVQASFTTSELPARSFALLHSIAVESKDPQPEPPIFNNYINVTNNLPALQTNITVNPSNNITVEPFTNITFGDNANFTIPPAPNLFIDENGPTQFTNFFIVVLMFLIVWFMAEKYKDSMYHLLALLLGIYVVMAMPDNITIPFVFIIAIAIYQVYRIAKYSGFVERG